MLKKILNIIAVTLLLSSCSTNKDNLTYFANLGNQTSGAIPSGNYELKIIPDDELIITVTSLVPEATAQFNTPMTNIATRSAASPMQQSSLMTYVVDRDGYIMMPVLGKIKVAGLTTAQISDVITKEVGKSVTDPYVRVQLMNFRVNVLGEVHSPGPKTTNKKRYSIIDAITDAGDLTVYGRRDNVLLIREENGQRVYHRINLSAKKVVNIATQDATFS